MTDNEYLWCQETLQKLDLYEIRRKNNWSVDYLNRNGISTYLVNKIEEGEIIRPSSLKQVLPALEKLGVDLSWVKESPKEEKEEEPEDEAESDPEKEITLLKEMNVEDYETGIKTHKKIYEITIGGTPFYIYLKSENEIKKFEYTVFCKDRESAMALMRG